MSYETVILGSWAALILVWIVAAFGVKRDIRGGGVYSVFYRYSILRIIGIVLVAFVAVRIVNGTDNYARTTLALFRNGIFTLPLAFNWIAAALVVLGIFFAIWHATFSARNRKSCSGREREP